VGALLSAEKLDASNDLFVNRVETMKDELEKRREVDLRRFHDGDRATLEHVYRAHYDRVRHAVGRYCRGTDVDTLIHEVFLMVIDRAAVRRSFKGGDLGAWLATIAANKAVDYLRRQRRHVQLTQDRRSLTAALPPLHPEDGFVHEDQLRELRQALRDFEREVVPQLKRSLVRVFEARFVRHLSQTEAAAELGIARTTLLDRERRLLRKLGPFLRKRLEGAPS
jgi:RNA polymerase sigma-70 factor (ECF subfamily)